MTEKREELQLHYLASVAEGESPPLRLYETHMPTGEPHVVAPISAHCPPKQLPTVAAIPKSLKGLYAPLARNADRVSTVA